MNNKLSLKTQRIFMLCITAISFLLHCVIMYQPIGILWQIVSAIIACLFALGYYLISKQYFIEQGYRIKWKFSLLTLKKVDWSKYDFHITPVLTFTHVDHPSGLANSNGISIEWGHWAMGFIRMKIKVEIPQSIVNCYQYRKETNNLPEHAK